MFRHRDSALTSKTKKEKSTKICVIKCTINQYMGTYKGLPSTWTAGCIWKQQFWKLCNL